VRRRRTPVDAQIAPVLSIAARHGVACPTIARLVAMIHECEAGVRPASDDNLLDLMRG
jgi:2-dehydropantoate 2-reductase